MSTIFVSLFFYDPDWPEQVALVEMDAAKAKKSKIGRALLGKLMNEEVSSGTFAGCTRAGGAMSNEASDHEVVHAYLYDVANAAGGREKVRKEAKVLLEKGKIMVDRTSLLDRYDPGFLIIEMAFSLKHLSSDSFEGLHG